MRRLGRATHEIARVLYVRVILALAPLVVCLAFSLEKHFWRGRVPALFWFSAGLFAVSVFNTPLRVLGALPWLLLTSWRAGRALYEFYRGPKLVTHSLAHLAALLYLPVGAICALFDQLAIQPLGFSGIIVLLTGVHFHYAGFALPRLTGLWLEACSPERLQKAAAWGVIFGVPLVAVGITTSQLNMPFWIETGAVSILAASAFTVSLGQLRWAVQTELPSLARVLFVMGGLALGLGMVLATIYGWRHVFPVSWATIPLMYSFHGTLNSLGFCLPGFVAWRLAGPTAPAPKVPG